jgi:4-methyl-5(b-hydroxyethyl)-thiazole monophosphate biosynthesis
MEKTVLVPVADGTEELEAVAIIDVLRRAGAAGDDCVGDRQAADQGITRRGHRGRRVDRGLRAQMDFDLVVLPGGIPGAQHLRDCADLVTHPEAPAR